MSEIITIIEPKDIIESKNKIKGKNKIKNKDKSKNNDTKGDHLQVRVSELEKQVIADKAELLEMDVSEYVRFCCIFSNASDEFMRRTFAKRIENK